MVVALVLTLALTPIVSVHADTEFYQDQYPYRTYTVDYLGDLTATQTAFTPLGIVNGDVVLNQPQDLFIRDGSIYIADAGNKRIAVLDYAGNLILEIGVGTLENPTGVFVSEEGFVYVADKGNALVYKFDADGILVRTFERPVEPLFGTASLYIPTKIVVGAGENIYVVGDGSTSGVIQLNYDGSFLGYFGVNLSSKSLLQKIAEVFVQGDVYAANVPPSPTNIAINIKSLVYTATPNTEAALKKLDVNGNNVLTTVNYFPSQNVVDLAVNDAGYLYAIYDDGLVVEYDPAGNLLFAFDIVTGTQDILGLVGRPTGIAIDESGYLFVLDAGNGANSGEIAVYAPTAIATLVQPLSTCTTPETTLRAPRCSKRSCVRMPTSRSLTARLEKPISRTACTRKRSPNTVLPATFPAIPKPTGRSAMPGSRRTCPGYSSS